MKYLLPATLVLGSLSLIACTQTTPPVSGHAQSVAPDYTHAVRDAALVNEQKLAKNLVAIHPQNAQLIWNNDKTKILVATWKSKDAYENFLKPNHATSSNPDHATWVTAAPQVQEFCQSYLAKLPLADKARLDLRLKQYLGLNADWNYDVFVEMWVSPNDVFRPCVDPEINDNQCNLQFGEKLPQVKNIPDYAGFYKNLYFKSFRASSGIPWTGLGYTYDWGNLQSSIGASEFILAPQSEYQIERVVSTWDYCKTAQ
jgi:hypothetical protein